MATRQFEIESLGSPVSCPETPLSANAAPPEVARSMLAPKLVLVAGGGVAGLEALLALRELAGRRVELTLVSPTDDFAYRPVAVAEPFGHSHAPRFPLTELTNAVHAELIRGRIVAVDTLWRIAVTSTGLSLPYDMLLVTAGTQPEPALHGALTWTPESDPSLLGGLLRDIEEGYSKRIAFVVPPGVAWTLPLYELALLTASRAWNMGQDDVELTIYTEEPAPVALLGSRASDAIRRELELAGVEVRTGVCVYDDALSPGRLIVQSGGGRRIRQHLDAERVLALPRAMPTEISGLPHDEDGFVPVDTHCRVRHTDAVWAAGDVTDLTIKQGGLAAQQADAAAEAIAAAAGVDIQPAPFQPVLRGVMLTGRSSHWMPHDPDRHEDAANAADRGLWWPPTKIEARYLTPFLTTISDTEQIKATRPIGLPFSHDLEGQLTPNGYRARAQQIATGQA